MIEFLDKSTLLGQNDFFLTEFSYVNRLRQNHIFETNKTFLVFFVFSKGSMAKEIIGVGSESLVHLNLDRYHTPCLLPQTQSKDQNDKVNACLK